MSREESSPRAGERPGDVASLAPWGVLVLVLVVGGLVLSARAGDDYTAVAGLLFAGFGVLLGFRLVARVLP